MAAYTAIDDPEAYFQVKTYTGDGAGSLALTLDGDTDMQPDLVWIKNRSSAENHAVVDAVRGVGKQLLSNSNAGEYSNANSVSAFNSDGFTVGDLSDTNGSGNALVAWCWKESATAGFDIVGYTGNATARTISHSLSAVPKVILGKRRSDASNWCMYHASHGNTKALYLNDSTTGATSTTFWNDTNPTSSVFTVGTDAALNGNTDTQIAYLFSEKQGFSKFGTYVGNGNSGTDGTFVYLGFRPAMVLVKRTNGAKDWKIFDIKRNGYNGSNEVLEPNNSDAEDTTEFLHFLSNGFKWVIPSSDAKYADVNGEDDIFVYAAFAYSPFVNSEGVPNNAV